MLALKSCACAFVIALIFTICFAPSISPKIVFAQAIDAEAVRNQILNGVATLANPTQPGKMVVFGDNAYSIANYKDEDHREPMIAAAGWGSGRVLAMGDHQWLNMDNYGNVDDTGALYLNSIAWLADTTDKTIKIVVTPSTNAVTWLGDQGFTNVVQSSNYATELADADLLVGWLGSSVAQPDLDTISTFVNSGGGLFIVDYGVGYSWWWNTDLPESPGNKLLRDVGIGFSGDWPSGTLDLTRATGQTTAQDILDMLDDPTAFTADELDIGGAVLTRIYQVLPTDDPLTLQLDTAYYQRINNINPTGSTPTSDSFDKSLLTREALLLAETLPSEVTLHRLAQTLYGYVPVTATRVTQTVTLDTGRSRWHPTGLFVTPGEVVTVTVPAALVGEGYKVRINAHTDNISARSSWERPPVVHHSFLIEQEAMPVANAFGGLLFIDVGSTPPDIGLVDILVENAVEAPYFDLSQHTDQEWNDSLRDRPAPFGVLVSEKMIISLPKRHIEDANLTEPTALMAWWNRTVFLEDDLSDQTQFRTSAELANVDVQISAGAAHSGYPYQAYEKHWGNMADWGRLSIGGSWGDFHELGHNHQRDWWTFDGDVEVTVNIFSNYAVEMLGSTGSGGWYWSADPVAVIDEAIDNVSGGGTYSSKSNRWSFWFQLADGFGWDAYRQVFSGYEEDNAGNASALPTTNQEEKDQWLVRFSNHVGYDMSCFMVDIWGLAVTQSAEDLIDHLPCWLPVVGGNLDTIVPAGGSHTFDIAGSARSMDMVANVASVSAPINGAIAANGDGTWTYTPTVGFIGQEIITYTLESSVGNTQTFTITADVDNHGALMETWYDISGAAVADLTNHADYPQGPDDSTVIRNFETDENRADDYGTRIRAWLRPPASGDYTFWTASDDASVLLLSSDADADNAVQIAQLSSWTSQYNWEQYGEQKSAPISLVAGRRYYIEALIKEGGGGDHLAIAWEGPDMERQVIAAEYLRPYSEVTQFFLPIANSDQRVIEEDGSAVVYPLSNDTDGDYDPLSIVAVGAAANGLVVAAGSVVTYTPDADYYGVDQLTYTISDSNEGMVTGTIVISVTPVNDAPSFVIGADQSVDADAGIVTIPNWATAISPGPANEATQALQFDLTSSEPALFLTLPQIDSATGVLSFEPNRIAAGQSIVSVQLIDDGGTEHGGVDSSSVQTFTIAIDAVPTPAAPSAPTPTPSTSTPSSITTGTPNPFTSATPTMASTPSPQMSSTPSPTGIASTATPPETKPAGPVASPTATSAGTINPATISTVATNPIATASVTTTAGVPTSGTIPDNSASPTPVPEKSGEAEQQHSFLPIFMP